MQISGLLLSFCRPFGMGILVDTRVRRFVVSPRLARVCDLRLASLLRPLLMYFQSSGFASKASIAYVCTRQKYWHAEVL